VDVAVVVALVATLAIDFMSTIETNKQRRKMLSRRRKVGIML